MEEMKKYIFKCKKGYVGDFATEWWTQEDWDNYNKLVKEYKADGTYGEEFEVQVELKHNPLLDNLSISSSPTTTTEFRIFDLSKNGKREKD